MRPDQFNRLMAEAVTDQMTSRRAVVPEAGILLMRWFTDLCAARCYNGALPQPISHAEIEAYGRLHRWSFQPHHLAALRAMDAAWMDFALAEARRAAKGASGHPTGREQPISPALFDAVFN